jgi:hypothetical protein
MKKLIVSFAILISFSIQLKAQNYGLGNADPALFTKYKIPDTDLHSLSFNTNFNYSSTKSSNYYGNSYYNNNYSNSNENLTYSLSPKYYLLKESEERVFSLNLNVSGSYDYTRQVNDGQGTNDSKNKTNSAELNMQLNTSYDKYQDTGNMFYTLGSSILVDLYDYRQDNTYEYSSYNQNIKNQNYIISAGLGWGRVRNVTAVVTAIRLQERLKQVNALSKDLDEKTIEELAQDFSRDGYFSDVHDRPAKYIWQGIEKTLSDNGVTLSGLNQYADSYIRETLSEITLIRNEGFKTSINLEMGYNNVYDSNNPINEQLNALLLGTVSYSHQLNLYSQISFDAALSGGPNVISNPKIRQNYNLSAGLGYDYELTDRLFATLHNNFTLGFQNANLQGKSLSNDLSFVLHCFVEDNLALVASYTWDYSDNKNINYTWENEGNNHYVSIGFTYYIDRAMIF